MFVADFPRVILFDFLILFSADFSAVELHVSCVFFSSSRTQNEAKSADENLKRSRDRKIRTIFSNARAADGDDGAVASSAVRSMPKDYWKHQSRRCTAQ